MIKKRFPFAVNSKGSPQTSISDCPNTFRLVTGEKEEEIRPKLSTESYTLMFVLQGSVHIVFDASIHRHVVAGKFLAFYNPALRSVLCCDDTILILHSPPTSIVQRLDDCVHSFQSFSSEPLPILPPLSEWIEEMYAELTKTEYICSLVKEREMESKLLGYTNPGGSLGEVYIAYFTAGLFNRR